MLNVHMIMILIEKGGVLMLPLILFSVLALWIFLERFVCLRRAHSDPEPLFATVRELVVEHSQERACDWARQHAGPVAAIFQAVLQAAPQDKNDLEEVALMQARRELRRLTAHLPLLHLIAGLAPLVGLLGTVVGMVKAFQTVATAQSAVNPEWP